MHLLRTCFFFCSFLFAAAFPCFAQTDIGEVMDEINKNKVEEVSGWVTEIDAPGSVIVINGVTARGNGEQMRLKVPDSAKITQGAEDIDLDDIDPEDSVTVRYTVDRSSGELRAISIVDNNVANNQM
ncbi:MAG: hypothetical protein PHY94_04665 [Candidatus Omnitrophica bacterium]|nr:hypothetical protein [Candidatus Omnitrophota bacterium]